VLRRQPVVHTEHGVAGFDGEPSTGTVVAVDAANREPAAVEKEHERRLPALARVVQSDEHLAVGAGHGTVLDCRQGDIGVRGGELLEQFAGPSGRHLVYLWHVEGVVQAEKRLYVGVRFAGTGRRDIGHCRA
jgi:hypothetical protein